MTDWDRLTEYIYDYFPEPIYSRDDIEKWASESVPAWKYMKGNDKKDILDDWSNFVAPQIEDMIEGKPSIWGRIKRFLGRLF